MRFLSQSTNHWGGRIVRADEPNITSVIDGVYVPHQHDWCGLYDFSGALIPEAGTYRGPEKHLVLPRRFINELPPRNAALSGKFIYLGTIHPHYGHFLLSTLSRLWPVVSAGLGGRKILFDSAGGIESRFAKPYFAAIMDALSITPDDFQFISEPTWLNDVVVPGSSFVELLECHEEFRTLARHITTRLNGRTSRLQCGPRVYLSKSKLDGGVWRFTNEILLEQRLEQLGFDIIHPEQLSLAEQISLFAPEKRVISTMGSAIHTLVFGQAPASTTILCRENQVISNFSMIDALTDSPTKYLFPVEASAVEDPDFGLGLILGNPEGIANEIFEVSLRD